MLTYPCNFVPLCRLYIVKMGDQCYTCSLAALNRQKKIFGTFILDGHLYDYIRGLTIVLSTLGNRLTISRLVMKMSHSKSPECWAIIWLQVPE